MKFLTPRQALKIYKVIKGFTFTIRIGVPVKLAMWIVKKFIKWPKRTEVIIEHGWEKEVKR